MPGTLIPKCVCGSSLIGKHSRREQPCETQNRDLGEGSADKKVVLCGKFREMASALVSEVPKADRLTGT